MSQRSRREYKPTSKFLDYKVQEFIRSDGEGIKNKKTPIPVKSAPASLSAKRNKTQFTFKWKPASLTKKSPANLNSKRSPANLSKQNLANITSKQSPANRVSKRSPVLSAKRAAIHGRRKLSTDKIEILCESNVDSSPEVQDKSPEIRRSSRAVKPNPKLKEFLHSTRIAKSEQDSSSTKSDDVTNLHKKEVIADGRHSSKKTPSVANDMNTVDQESLLGCSKTLSLGLTDCFEGLAKDLAEKYPSPLIERKGKLRETKDQSKNKRKRGVKRSLVKDLEEGNEPSLKKNKKVDGSELRTKGVDVKNTLIKGKQADSKSRVKRSRLAPRNVRTKVEMVNLSTNQEQKINVQNKKLKAVKEYPVRIPVSTPTASKEAHFIASRVSASPLAVPLQELPNSQNKAALNQPKDIKETLKKFLIMGTKVANAISETLKHNEEALLSRSSAFEKKCLSLVHALAKQGTDLEEADMEKVLKLLDEEQEERRIYRHTLMESLRASHLTNMALYSQMLRLLKTL